MNLVKRPYNLLIVISILVLIIPFFLWGESVLIVCPGFKLFIDGKTIIYLVGILMIIYWIIYRMLSRYWFSNTLTWIHLIITIGTAGYFLASGTWYLKYKATSNAEAFILEQLLISKERTIRVISVVGDSFIFGQLIFISNLLIGLFKMKKNNDLQ